MKPLRILWISSHTPFLTDFGGGQRSSMIYRTIRTVGEVDVLLVCPPHSPGRTVEQTHGVPEGVMEIVQPEPPARRKPWCWVRRFHPRLVDRIAHNLGRREADYERDGSVGAVMDAMLARRHYDLILGRHLINSAKAGALQFHPLIIDADDLETDLYRRVATDRATNPVRRMVLRRRVKTFDRIVPAMLRRCEGLWVSKPEDRALPGCEHASLLPNIPYAMSAAQVPEPLPPAVNSQTMLFVGMLSYVYNSQGISSFIKESLPLIRQSHPGAKLRLVGSRLAVREQAKWSTSPGVEVAGYVEDLRDAYRDCAFSVAPIWSGGGTNIKVVESLMHGRTCVISQPAHRGHGHLRDGEALRVAGTPVEMARHCIELLNHPADCAAMAERGSRAVFQSCDYRKFQRTVLDTVEHVLRTNPSANPRTAPSPVGWRDNRVGSLVS